MERICQEIQEIVTVVMYVNTEYLQHWLRPLSVDIKLG